MSVVHAPSEAARFISYSVFRTLDAAEAETYSDRSWDAFCSSLTDPDHIRPRAHKRELPLFSGCVYGELRSDKNSLRHAANVRQVYAVEGDHDAGTLRFDEAVHCLQSAGIACVLYTTPSHTEQTHRWRVIAVLAEPALPAQRELFVGRLNRVLHGALARESFTLSQSFFIGRVQGTQYRAQRVDGWRTVDEAADIEPLRCQPARSAGDVAAALDLSAWSDGELCATFMRAENRHHAMLTLSARWAKAGRTFSDIHHALLTLLDGSPDRDSAHWHELRRELPRICKSALERFPDPMAQLVIGGAPLADAEPTDSWKPHAEQPWPQPPDEAIYHGLAGRIVAAIRPDTEADPVAVLMHVLIAFGTLTGRHAYYFVEGARHYPNLFAVIIGETAKGRKGSAWSRARQVLDRIPGHPRVVSGLSTGEGLKYNVRDTTDADPGAGDKRLLVIESEFAGPLRVARREGNTLSVCTRDAWDTGNLQTLTKHDPIVATDAHICIIGHISAAELRRELTATDLASGFANRFLLCCARRARELPFGGRLLSEPQLDEFAHALALAADTARAHTRVDMDEQAAALWCEVYGELSAGRMGLFGAATARAEAQTVRLALLYALLDGAAAIERAHLAAALALWRYCEASALYVFGDALGDPVADEIARALRNAGTAGLSRTDLSNHFQRHESAERIGAALALLRARGLICAETQTTSGRPREVWRCVAR